MRTEMISKDGHEKIGKTVERKNNMNHSKIMRATLLTLSFLLSFTATYAQKSEEKKVTKAKKAKS